MISLHGSDGKEFLLNEDCIEAVFASTDKKNKNGSTVYITTDPGTCWEVQESVAELKELINNTIYGI